MSVEWVAGSSWNQWPDVYGIGGRMAVESAVKEKYRYLGIGMISFNQPDRVSALKNRVASYLTKVDYWIRSPLKVADHFQREYA